MILHTVMPIEAVLDGWDTYQPEYLELNYPGGGKLLLEQISPTEGRLVRLISSRAEDYLRPELQPGTLIPFRPSQILHNNI